MKNNWLCCFWLIHKMIDLYVISSQFWPEGRPELKAPLMPINSGLEIKVLYLHPSDAIMFNFDIDADSFNLITDEEYALLLLQLS